MLVLLDRDGVLNADLPDGVTSPEDLALLPGIPAALAKLTRAGCTNVVVTNQSVIGKGLVSEAELQAIHAKLLQEAQAEGGRIDAIIYCPDTPDAPTHRRKPAPGMLEEALEIYGAEATQTPMIGDALRDLQAAAALGCPRYLVQTGKGKQTLLNELPAAVQPVQVCADLAEAVEHIIANFAVTKVPSG